MWLYHTLMVYLLPLCLPLGIAALAASFAKSRVVFVVPILAAVIFMYPWHIDRAHIGWESEHMRNVAFWTTLIVLIIVQFTRSTFYKRQSPSAQFSIRTLLLVTTGCAVAIGIYRWFA